MDNHATDSHRRPEHSIGKRDYPAGNPSLPADITFTLDTTPPVVDLDDIALTNDSTPELTGTVDDPNADVVVTINGVDYPAVNNGDGTWTLADDVVATLADGTTPVDVKATDVAGNEGTGAGTVNVDATPPVAPTVALSPPSDTGVPGDNITNDPTPEIVGTGTPGDTITGTIGGIPFGPITVPPSGEWSFTPPADLPDGDVPITIEAEDPAGNTTPGTPTTITVDTVPPVVDLNDIALTNDSTPELTGTVDDPTAEVVVTIAGVDYPAVNNGDGTWTLADDVVATLADGTTPVDVKATDVAGNEGTGAGTVNVAAPTIGSVTDATDTEGTSLVHTVTLSNPSASAVTYNLSLVDGTATGGTDYTNTLTDAAFSDGVTIVGNTITVSAGVTSFTVTVPTTLDTIDEGASENYTLNVGTESGAGTITDDDNAPTISGIESGGPGATDDNVNEGTDLVYTVSLGNASSVATTYDYSLGGGTSTASAIDYGTAVFSDGVSLDVATGVLTVPAGVTSFTVTVPTETDAISGEPVETVELSIGNATSTVVGTGGIIDATAAPTMTVSDADAIEGTALVHTVTLSNPSAIDTTYSIALSEGAATADVDYTSALTDASFSEGVTISGGVITVPAGVTSFTVTVPSIQDAVNEGVSEDYQLTVDTVVATGTITDNDGSPTISSVSNATETEGTDLVHTVTLSNASSFVESFAYSLTDDTATGGGVDYSNATFSDGVSLVGSNLEVPAGVTSFTITVQSTTDGLYETNIPETYNLSIGGVDASGAIIDADSTPTIDSVTSDVQGEGTALVHTVTLSNPSVRGTSYNLSFADGSATGGVDYTSALDDTAFSNGVTISGGVITVPAGVTSFTVTVPTTLDTIDEGASEDYQLTVGGVSATGTITDDDGTPTISSVTSATETEGTALVHTVTLTNASVLTTSFAYSLADDTATGGGVDYSAAAFSNGVTLNGGSLEVPPGVTSFTVTVPSIADGTYEASPEVYNLSVGGVDATGTIVDAGAPVGPVTDADTDANTVSENAAIGDVVEVTGLATDPDGDTVTYSLTDDAGGLFTIDATTGVVTLAGNLDYETATSHDIEITATSTDGSTSAGTFTIDVTDVDESAPTIADGQTFDYAENQVADAVVANVVASDNDGVTGYTFTATGTDTSADGYYQIDNTGAVTITAAGVAAEVNDFETGTNTGTYNITVSDASGNTAAADIVLNETDVDDKPVIDLDGDDSSTATGADYTATFTEGDASPISIADLDSSVTSAVATNMESATIRLTNAKLGDVLDVGTMPAGITASVVGNVVTLTGSASLADYEAAIEAVTYETVSDNPDTVARVITVVVNDGVQDSNVATTTINVVAVNDAPINTVPTTLAAVEGTPLSITGLSIADADALTGSMTVTLTMTNGTLDVTGGTATVVGTGTDTVTLTGTLGQINATLAANVTYVQTANFNGTATLTMETNDNGNTGGAALTDTDTVDIVVDAVNDAPVNALPSTNYTTDEDTAVQLTGLSITDVDAGTGVMKVTLTVTDGSITGNSVGGVSVFNASATTIELTGTLADLNAYLSTNAPTYTPVADFNGQATLSMTTDDQGNTGSGGALTDADTIAIDVAPVNDAPVLSDAGDSVIFRPHIGAEIIDSTLTITDVDDTHIESATVTITGNFAAGEDVLVFTDANGITGSYDAATGVLTLTGSATKADYEAALESITYNNTSDIPAEGVRTVSWTVNDGDINSNTVTSNVLVGDNDGDGILDSVDVDDDNDGILDTEEKATMLQSQTVNILGGDPAGGYTFGGSAFGNLNAKMNNDANFGAGGTVTEASVNVIGTTTTIDAAYLAQGTMLFDGYTSGSPYTAAELDAIDTWVRDGGILFSTNDNNSADPVSTYYGLEAGRNNNVSNTWVIQDVSDPYVASLVDGSIGLGVDLRGQTITAKELYAGFDEADLQPGDIVLARDANMNINGEYLPTVVVRPLGDGYIIFTGDEGVFREVTTGDTFDANDNEDAFAAAIIAWGVEAAADDDGSNNALDIDSDNDGITDNVEAQTIDGYIAPSGTGAGITDLNQDGLDDNYDNRTVTATTSAATAGAGNGAGLTPIDTDGDGAADVIDYDSDDDGIDDIAERGDGAPTSMTSTTDTDGDGLLDIFEGTDVNDGFDVNDENLANLSQTDGEYDFRFRPILDGDVLFTDDFEGSGDMEGWVQTAGTVRNDNGTRLRFEGDSTATKTFDFGVENAGEQVTITFDAINASGWDAGSDTLQFSDSTGVRLTTTSLGTQSFTAIVQPDGTITLTIVANPNFNWEDVAIDNLVISAVGSGWVQTPELTSAQLVDGIVEGLYYETSSGLTGYTDADGNFDYLPDDVVTFKLGNVAVGFIDTTSIEDGKVFLQDIADVDRTDLNDEYLENMAVLLQSLDSDDGDNIVITQAMHDALSGEDFDLATISEEELASILESIGVEAVSEDAAMEHVQDMLEAYTDLEADDFDARTADDTAAANTIMGTAGDDVIVGTDGDDTIVGGDDTLTGGGGADVFKWDLNDDGVAGNPAADVVTDFDIAGSDVLDLRDLLVGESHAGNDVGNLAEFLHFEQSGNDTVVHINSEGNFAGGFDAAQDTQTITLQNVDLVTGFANDQAIIQDLLANSKLVVD